MRQHFNKLIVGIGMLCSSLAYAQTIQVSTPLSGTTTYSYIARDKVSFKPGAKYKPSSSSFSLDAKIDEKIVLPATIATSIVPNMRAALNTSLEVGSTAGLATVNVNGQSIYTIPVFTPPGTAGMEPQVNIQYYSQRDMGLLGYGWDLTGLSMITRTGENMYFDDEANSVTFTNTDAFVYDGQRILPTTGYNGADGTEYGTESESFVKVISHNLSGITGPGWFEVKTKDGSVLEFGNTTDSRFTGLNGTILTWRISKITDANGNYMTFTYLSETDEQAISKIAYTGNATAGITAYNSIEFYYDRNPDVTTKYISGRKQVNSLLLRRIKCFGEGNVARQYSFTYGKDLYAKLTEIQESGLTGESYNSTLINWGESAHAKTKYELLTQGSYSIIEGNAPVAIGDVNGDSKSDMIFFYDQRTNPNPIYSYEIYKSGTTFAFNDWIPYDMNSSGPASISLIDDNDDNTDEIYRLDYTSGTFTFNRNPALTGTNTLASSILGWQGTSVGGSGLTYENITLVPINTSGDYGAKTVVAVRTVQRTGKYYNVLAAVFSPQSGVIPSTTGLFNETSSALSYTRTLKFADLNGDGKTEIIELSNSPTSPYLNVFAQNNFSDLYEQVTPSLVNLGYWDYLEFADLNGDGNMDVLQHGSDVSSSATKTWRVFYFTGTGNSFSWTKAYDFTQLDALVGNAVTSVFINDMNRDGKVDLFCVPSTNNLSILKNNGTGSFVTANFTQSDYVFMGMEQGVQPVFGDFDGNGLTDMYVRMKRYNANGTALTTPTDHQYYFITFYSGEYGNLVSNVIDGYNNVNKFEYTVPNTRYSTDYITPQTGTFKGLRITCPVFQVAAMYKQNVANTENYEKAAFTYAQPVFNTQGKGFLGFQTVTKTTTWSGISNTNEVETYSYSLNTTNVFLYPLYTLKTALQSGVNVNHSRIDYEYEMVTGAPYTYKRYWQRVKKETTNDYLKALTTVVDYQQYDASGNVTQLKKQNTGTGTIPVSIVSQYVSAPSTWPYLNRLSAQTVTYGAGTETGSVRTTNYTYDAKGNMLTKVQDPSLAKALTATYVYNNCGLPTQQTLSASGETSRVSTFAYDTKNRFVLSTTNALSQVTQRTYDAAYGNMLTQKDPDGKSVSLVYNSLGRMTSSTDKAGTVTTYNRQWESSTSSKSVYYETIINPEMPDATVWYDNLGRKTKTGTINQNGDVVYVDYTMNNRFLLTQQSRPYLFTQSATQFITYTYDEFKRPASTNDNNSRITNITYPDARTVTTTLVSSQGISMNKVSTQALNDDGQVSSMTDNGGTISYVYWMNGKLKGTTAVGAPALIEYDDYGNQSKLNDADGGLNLYEYNAFGDMTKQTHPGGTTTSMEYNVLGMITKKTHNNSAGTQPEVTTYTYNSSGGGINKPATIAGSAVNQVFTYNGYGQVLSLKETVNSQNFTTAYTYSSSGQHLSTTYPSGLVIKKMYDSYGRMNQLNQVGATGVESVLWKANNFNTIGQLTQALLGPNALKYNSTYDGDYQLASTTLLNASNTAIYQYQYSFMYETGNLMSRTNVLKGLAETYGYDNLDRLVGVNLNGVLTQTLTFSGNGNIQTKSDVSSSSYAYNSTPPHAVAYIPSPLITIPSFTQTTSYNIANRITNITQGSDVMNFTYGPDDERRMTVYQYNGSTQSTHYYSGNYEKEVTSSGTKEYHYIYSQYGMVAMISRSGGTDNTYYTCTDHLGNINALADNSGTLSEEYNTDAWGRRRNPNNWTYSSVPTPTLTNRCYTGHEHLDKFGLINMNARLYDPIIARMLNADNEVQDITYSQNYNRYSYVFNNPLKFTDPTGNSAKSGKGFESTKDFYFTQSIEDLNNINLESQLFNGAGGGATDNPNNDPDNKDQKGFTPAQQQQTAKALAKWGKIIKGNKLGGGKPQGKQPIPAGHVDSYSLGFAFVGGISLEYGTVTDTKGNSEGFINISGNIGFGIGAGYNSKDIYNQEGNDFKAGDYAGSGFSISGNGAIVGISRGGNIDSNKGPILSQIRRGGLNYWEESTSIGLNSTKSVKASLGAYFSIGRTILIK